MTSLTSEEEGKLDDRVKQERTSGEDMAEGRGSHDVLLAGQTLSQTGDNTGHSFYHNTHFNNNLKYK